MEVRRIPLRGLAATSAVLVGLGCSGSVSEKAGAEVSLGGAVETTDTETAASAIPLDPTPPAPSDAFPTPPTGGSGQAPDPDVAPTPPGEAGQGGMNSGDGGGGPVVGAGGSASGQGGDSGQGGGGSGQGGGDSGSAGAASGGGSAAVGAMGGGSGEPEPEPIVPRPAYGIHLTEIELNQAVGIPLAEDGAPVDPEDRVFPGDIQLQLVMERGGLFRLFYELEDDFEPRELSAILTLRHADGSEDILYNTRFVDGPPDRDEIDGTFHWKLEGNVVLPGTEYSVELLEAEGSDAPTADTPPRIPQDGLADLGVVDQPMKLMLTLYPVTVNGVEPKLNEENVARIVDGYYDMYPISEVLLEVREGTDIGRGDDVDDVLEDAIRTRQADDPERFRHYVGLAPQSEIGWSGTASRSNRAAGSPMTDDADWTTVGFAVHETGHTIDMDHTPGCNAGSATRQWPYDDTTVQVQGYSIRYDRLYDPGDFEDYMNYCTPDWVSPFTYMLSYELIREENSELNRDEPLPPPILLLSGMIKANSGSVSWWTSVGTLPSPPPDAQPVEVHVTSLSGALSVEVGYIEALTDGGSSLIAAGLPIPEEEIARLEVLAAGVWHSVDLEGLPSP